TTLDIVQSGSVSVPDPSASIVDVAYAVDLSLADKAVRRLSSAHRASAAGDRPAAARSSATRRPSANSAGRSRFAIARRQRDTPQLHPLPTTRARTREPLERG